MNDFKDGRRSAATITLTAPEGFEFLLDENGKPSTALDASTIQDGGEHRFLLKKKYTPVVVPAARQHSQHVQVRTVGSVYGNGNTDVVIPMGYRFVDFRLPTKFDSFLDSMSQAVLIRLTHPPDGPRIIVEKEEN